MSDSYFIYVCDGDEQSVLYLLAASLRSGFPVLLHSTVTDTLPHLNI